MEFSEDEGLTPDQPVFTGLFHPTLFKSLLFKARNSTHLGMDHSGPEAPVASTDITEPLFSEQTMKAEVIPLPQMFIDVVQRQ